MRIYTIEETGYNDLHKVVDKMCDVVKCAKKVLEEVEESEYGSRMGWRKRYDEDEEDYDWKIKKGRGSRY